MPFNYYRSQSVAAKMITKYGMPAKLRRGSPSVDRDCTAVEIEFTPQERLGKLTNPTDRIFLIVSKDLPTGPLFGKDVLVTLKVPDYSEEDEVLKIMQPPSRLSPAGVVIYWEVVVSR